MDESMEFADTKKESFLINILFRQNATWQGSITWIDQKKTLNFRSTLEMLKLMDSVVSDAEPGAGEWK